MKKYIIILVVIMAVISLSGFLPFNGEMMSNTYQLSSSEACYAVTGSVNQSGLPDGSMSGPITGDLVGIVHTTGGPAEIHGIVIFRDVVQIWEITGGNIEELVGRTLVFENKFRGIINDYPMLKVNTTGILVEGADKGSLTLHGWTIMGDPPENYLDYHAVICP